MKKNSFILRYPNFYKVLYVSILLFFYQGIANTLVGILSQITHQNGRDWAGPVSTMLLFLCSGIGALYNKYIKVCKFGIIMYIASFGYTFYVGSSIIFILIGQTQSIGILVLVFILTAVSGFVVSALYNCQFNYVDICGSADNTAMYFGVNLVIVQASNIGGNLLSTFTIVKLGQLHYCIMMTVLIGVVSLGFLFIRQIKNKQSSQKLSEESQNTKNINEEIVTNQPSEVQLPKKNIARLVPSFYMSGVIVTYVYTCISIIMYKAFDSQTPEKLNQLTFNIFIFEGLGQLLGGILVIYGADRFNKCRQLLIFNNIFMLGVTISYIGYFYANIYLIGISSFFLGICDCGIFSMDLAVIGQQKWDKRGFSIFGFAQCVGVAVSIFLIIFVNLEVFFVYVIVCQIVSSISLHGFK